MKTRILTPEEEVATFAAMDTEKLQAIRTILQDASNPYVTERLKELVEAELKTRS